MSDFRLHGREHVDRTHLPKRPQESVGGPRVVIHHLDQVVELSAILNRELAIGVHVQQVVVDHPIVAQTEGKTVDLHEKL